MDAYPIRFVLGVTKVDYDPNKDEANIAKHGYSLSCAVDIIESVLLLQRPCFYEIVKRHDEERFNMLAEYQGKVVHVTATMRDEETARVISMHNASREDRKYYEENPPQYDISELIGD
jgi:uncharacterized DUF497 family protein